MRRIVAARIRAHADRLARDVSISFDQEGGAYVEALVRYRAPVTREELLAELARGLGGVEEHAAVLAAVEDVIRERPGEERVRDLGRYAGHPSALDELRAASKGRWDGVDVEAFMREHRGEDA